MMAKMLMILGALIFFSGAFLYYDGKIPGIGRLPGDIFIERESFRFHFPVATSIIASIVLTVVLNFLFWRR